jgi:hypothetical protein
VYVPTHTNTCIIIIVLHHINHRYFWGGVVFGFPSHVPGAAARYVALTLLARALYDHLM